MRLQLVYFSEGLSPKILAAVTEQYCAREHQNSRISHYDVGLCILRRHVLDKLGVEGDERKQLERFFGHVHNLGWNKKYKGLSEDDHKLTPLYTQNYEEGLSYVSRVGKEKAVAVFKQIQKECYELSDVAKEADEHYSRRFSQDHKNLMKGDMFFNPINETIMTTEILLGFFDQQCSLVTPRMAKSYVTGSLEKLISIRFAALEKEKDPQKRVVLEQKLRSVEKVRQTFCQ